MEAKKFRINTVQDMIDCTNEENLDRFLKDLKNLIETAHAFERVSNVLGDINGLSEKERKVTSEGFDWIDDGENKLTIKFNTAKPSKYSNGNK